MGQLGPSSHVYGPLQNHLGNIGFILRDPIVWKLPCFIRRIVDIGVDFGIYGMSHHDGHVILLHCGDNLDASMKTLI